MLRFFARTQSTIMLTAFLPTIMKLSTKYLVAIVGAGLLYSIYKLLAGQGGSGLGDFLDALVVTSIILFLASLITLVIQIGQIRKHADTFFFLLLGFPMTLMAAKGLVHKIDYNRMPDLAAKYPRPFSQNYFIIDSLRIAIQVDSLVALRNRHTGGLKVASAFIDTIIYSQSGNKVFVVYAMQYESNHLGNDLGPGYLSADAKDSVYWHLYEGTPNAEQMSGSFHSIADLKRAVRKFYFNQYSFIDADSLRENYFWRRN